MSEKVSSYGCSQEEFDKKAKELQEELLKITGKNEPLTEETKKELWKLCE